MSQLKLDICMHADTINERLSLLTLGLCVLACELWFKKKVETGLRFVKRFEGF